MTVAQHCCDLNYLKLNRYIIQKKALFVFSALYSVLGNSVCKPDIIHHHHHPLCRNLMESLPDWLCEAKKLEVLDVSHNLISELPAR